MLSLVSSVEIKYFRSIHTARLRGLPRMTIISGRNDVGKSNVLRALNLFFNGEVEWGTNLQFQRDFSAKRLTEVRQKIKGKQFIQVKIELDRPPTYRRSLPPTVQVTRSWSRDGRLTEKNNLERLDRDGKLPGSLASARKSVSQLLNRIHYEYVPAVKDRAYFDRLLQRLQAELLANPLESHPQLSQLAEDLADNIDAQVIDLQREFERATGVTTLVRPPEEMSALFRAFYVSTASGSHEAGIPLRLRGDGVQARYIASVLHHISRSTREFVIWGFEEPENSLEYSHAAALAEDFADVYAKEAQIFVTTHSPAFVSLDRGTCAVFRAVKEGEDTHLRDLRRGRPDELQGELGYHELQLAVHDQYVRTLQELDVQRGQVAGLEAELSELEKPLVLVEGPTDRQLLELAWAKVRSGSCPFAVRVADPHETSGEGGGGAPSLRKFLETVHPESGKLVVGMFDRDRAGIDAFNKLAGFQTRDDGSKIHKNRRAAAILLPTPDFREDFGSADNLVVEFLFPDNTLEAASQSGVLVLEDKLVLVGANGRPLSAPNDVDLESLSKANRPSVLRVKSGKTDFVHFVRSRERDEFAGFEPVFDELVSVLSEISENP